MSVRVGGAFPFGQQAVAVDLAGGGVYYVPPGQYWMNLGQQTVLQWFNPTTLQWFNTANVSGGVVEGVSVDGYNYRLVNMSGVVSAASITNAGSGAVNGIGAAATGVAISFGAAPASGIAAAAYPIVGGAISSTITIAQAGSGFTFPPAIFIDPPPQGGIQATARCTISGGAINAVTVDNVGAGYLSAPNVYIVPQWPIYPGIGVPVNPAGPPAIIPPGLVAPVAGISSQPYFLPDFQWPAVSGPTGALLTATLNAATSGTLTGFVMTDYGVGYTGTTIPTIVITGAGAAAATALMSMATQSITITAGGAAYAGTQVLESDLGQLTALTSFNNNMALASRPMRGRATQSGGVINATVIEDPGFGFQTVPVIGVIQTNTTPATTIATLTPVTGGVADTSYIQPAIW